MAQSKKSKQAKPSTDWRELITNLPSRTTLDKMDALSRDLLLIESAFIKEPVPELRLLAKGYKGTLKRIASRAAQVVKLRESGDEATYDAFETALWEGRKIAFEHAPDYKAALRAYEQKVTGGQTATALESLLNMPLVEIIASLQGRTLKEILSALALTRADNE